METIKRLKVDQSVLPTDLPTPVSPEPTWSQSVPKLAQPSIRHNKPPSKPPNCALPPTPAPSDGHQRRPSSPDILGAERRSVRLVSRPTSIVTSPVSVGVPSMPLPASSPRISAWVNEQTETASWPPNNGEIENEAKMRYNSLANALDQYQAQNKTKSPSVALSNGSRGGRVTSVYTEGGYSTADSYMSAPRTSAMIPSSETRTTSLAQNIPTSYRDPLHVIQHHPLPVVPVRHFENGLMLANESNIDVAERRSTRSFTNRLMGAESSLYKQGGFCSGALKFRTQGHQAATKGAMEYVSSVACTKQTNFWMSTS